MGLFFPPLRLRKSLYYVENRAPPPSSKIKSVQQFGESVEKSPVCMLGKYSYNVLIFQYHKSNISEHQWSMT